MAAGRRSLDILVVVAEGDGAVVPSAAAESEHADEVTTVTDSEEAARRLREGGIDVVIGHHHPPSVDGLESFSEIRDADPEVPFVLVPRDGSESLASDAISAGVTEYVRHEAVAENPDEFLGQLDELAGSDDGRDGSGRRRLGVLFEQSPFGIIEWDESLSVKRVNGRAERLLGASESEMTGAPWGAVVGSEAPDGATLEHPDSNIHRTVTETDDSLLEWHTHSVTDETGGTAVVSQFLETGAPGQSHQLLEAIVDNLPGIVYKCRNEAGWPIEFVSGECESLTGYTAAEIESGEVTLGTDLIHPDDQQSVWKRVQEAIDCGESFEVTYRIRTKDGGVRWVRERGSSLRNDGDVEGLEGFIVDITDEKRRQQELERFERIFEELNDAVYVLDSDERLVYVNDTYTSMKGADKSEILGSKITEWAAPDSIAEVRETRKKIKRGDSDVGTVENDFISADGERIPVEFRLITMTREGGETERVGVLRDITDRKERERRLEALHETTRKVMAAETVEDICEHGVDAARNVLGLDICGIHLLNDEGDGLDPVVTSDPIGDIFGEPPVLRPGESIAWNVYESGEAMVVDDLHEHPDAYDQESELRSDLLVPLGDHGVLLAGSRIPGAFDDSDLAFGELLGANLTAALDRAEREAALRERERQLQREVERLDQFASIVSHDLRNPLNVASGRLELARMEADSEHLERVAVAHERMETLIEDLLTLAREGQAVDEMTWVDVPSAFEGCWENVDTADSTLVTADELTVRADESRLKQLFENLIRNAVEHGSTGPDSQARQDSVEHGEVTVTVGALENGSGFYVEDDGPGIPADERERVFEAGYSTADGGTGFGLSIIKQIVDAHGWDISIEEGTDGGARFEVRGVDVR